MRKSLQDGVNQLARAGNDRAVLGMALINLHAGMETFFRTQLADEISQYEAKEQKRTTWQDLINFWEAKHGLPRNDRERLFQYNSLRNDIAHGKPHTLSRGQVEAYARFVQDFTGVRISPEKITPITTPPPVNPERGDTVRQKRGCSCLTRLVAVIIAIPLLIGGYLVVNYFLLNGLETSVGESGLDLFEDLVEDLSGRSNVPPTVTVSQTAVPSNPSATPNKANQNQTLPASNNGGEDALGITIRVLAQSNVRSGPSLESGPISIVPSNAEYTIQETSPDGNWYKIELEPGVTGWIGSSRVERISP